MRLEIMNVSAHEIPITVTTTDYFGHSKYPGIVLHKWQEKDFVLLDYADSIIGIILVLVTSSDFLREYIAGNLAFTHIDY